MKEVVMECPDNFSVGPAPSRAHYAPAQLRREKGESALLLSVSLSLSLSLPLSLIRKRLCTPHEMVKQPPPSAFAGWLGQPRRRSTCYYSRPPPPPPTEKVVPPPPSRHIHAVEKYMTSGSTSGLQIT